MRLPLKVFEGWSKWKALTPAERGFFLVAWSLAPCASVLVRSFGFTQVLDALEATRGRATVNAARQVGIERGEALVASAFHFQLVQQTCLPRSIVQFVLHRRYGPAPKLVIGVQRATGHGTTSAENRLAWDLNAHAWVEADAGPARDLGYAPIVSFSDQGGVWRARGTSPVAHP